MSLPFIVRQTIVRWLSTHKQCVGSLRTNSALALYAQTVRWLSTHKQCVGSLRTNSALGLHAHKSG